MNRSQSVFTFDGFPDDLPLRRSDAEAIHNCGSVLTTDRAPLRGFGRSLFIFPSIDGNNLTHMIISGLDFNIQNSSVQYSTFCKILSHGNTELVLNFDHVPLPSTQSLSSEDSAGM